MSLGFLRSRHRKASILLCIGALLASVDCTIKNADTPDSGLPADAVVVTKPTVSVKTESVDSTGKVVTVADPASPLNGLTITFPQGAVASPVDISIGYADIDLANSKFPSETAPVTKLLVLKATPPVEFSRPVIVKIPYDASLVKIGDFINVYEYVNATVGGTSASKLEAATPAPSVPGSLSFAVRHFSGFLGLEWARRAVDILQTSADFNVDTGFSATKDGWFIANRGSILNPGGDCIGMSSFAKWFFTWKGLLSDTKGLYDKYRLGDPNRWQDDSCAIEAASRMQLGESAIWTRSAADMNVLGKNSLDTAKAIVQAMRDTGQPQILYVTQKYADGTSGGAHAILATGYRNGVFTLYDPNVPGTSRSVNYTYGASWGIYASGTSATSSRFQYNMFGLIGPSLFHGFDDAANIYTLAERTPCFKDVSLFPTVNLTAPTDTNADGKYEVESTTQVGTTLKGTITGGSKQPTHAVLYVNATKFDLVLGAGGSFTQKVPLFCATTASTANTINLENKDNIVEFLVTEANEWENYAGYARYIVSCTGPTPLAKVTLTWSTPLDIDLHAGTPDGQDVGYRGINYQRQSVQTAPYLDYDDIPGTGPEHLFFDSTLPIQEGTYSVRVNYFSKGSNTTAPTVGYTVKVELGFLLDGVPKYETPQYFSGTLSSVGETQSVTSFAYPLAAQDKVLSPGAQDK
ncbi:MAG: hypothetical protein WCI05_06795 [Myxococcales bacterium]